MKTSPNLIFRICLLLSLPFLLLMIFIFRLSINDVIIVVLTWALVSTTINQGFISQRTMWHQALLAAQKDYRSPEMFYALRRLWSLYDECTRKFDKTDNYRLKKNITRLINKGMTDEAEEIKKQRNNLIEKRLRKKYRTIYKADEKRILNEKYESFKTKYLKTTVDAQRRIVTQFFEHLYDLINNNILDRKIAYDYWGDYALETVKRISIPLEEELVDIISEKRPTVRENKGDILNKLCDLIKDHEKYRKRSRLFRIVFC